MNSRPRGGRHCLEGGGSGKDDNNGQVVPGALGFLSFSSYYFRRISRAAFMAILNGLLMAFSHFTLDSPGMHLGMGDHVPFLQTGVELWVFWNCDRHRTSMVCV